VSRDEHPLDLPLKLRVLAAQPVRSSSRARVQALLGSGMLISP
jgi:hypothetical protein